MRIQNLLLSIVLVFISSTKSYAQISYSGKNSSVTFGIANNFQYMKLDNGFGLTKDKDLVLPKIRLGFEHQLPNSTFRLEVGYQMLPNVYKFESSTYLDDQDQTITQLDSAGIRSNNFKIGAHFRNFLAPEPIGFYIQFGLILNFIANRAIHSTYYVSEMPQGNYITTESLHNTKKKWNSIPVVELSLGRAFPLNDKLCLDIGLQGNYVMARLNPDIKQSSLITQKRIRWANTRTIFGSSLIEIYVNIQLFY
jgi:hypothetical protein